MGNTPLTKYVLHENLVMQVATNNLYFSLLCSFQVGDFLQQFFSGDVLGFSGVSGTFSGDVLGFSGDFGTFTGDVLGFSGVSRTLSAILDLLSAISTRLSAILSCLLAKPDTS